MQGTIFECMAWLADQDPERRYEVKELRKRRSLTQNAYYWAMLNKLAHKLRMPTYEVHLNMLRDYGVHEVFSVRADVPLSEVAKYARYHDVMGTGWAGGRKFNHVRVYKGSSQMDSAEFSRLIDGMREECELQGIDVATPTEIARMRFIEPERG